MGAMGTEPASIETSGDELDVLDGANNLCTYRVAAYPSERYRPTDS